MLYSDALISLSINLKEGKLKTDESMKHDLMLLMSDNSLQTSEDEDDSIPNQAVLNLINFKYYYLSLTVRKKLSTYRRR